MDTRNLDVLRWRLDLVRRMASHIIEQIDNREPLSKEAVDRATAMFVGALQGTTKGKVDDRTLARRAVFQALRQALAKLEVYGDLMPELPPLTNVAVLVMASVAKLHGLNLPRPLVVAALEACVSGSRRRERINDLLEAAGLELAQERTERELWRDAEVANLITPNPFAGFDAIIEQQTGK